MPQVNAALVSAVASTSRVFGFLTVGALLATFFHDFYNPCHSLHTGYLLKGSLVVAGVGLLTGTIVLAKGTEKDAKQSKRARMGIRLCLGAPVLFVAALTASITNRHVICSDRVNAAEAISSIRSVISAQVAYASANAGYYDLPSCLLRPWDCIPGYEPPASRFLDDETASASVRRGYVFTFHPGPAAEPKANTSTSSITAWAYVAVPEEPGVTGHWGFCGDWTGRICFRRDGSAPLVVDGSCRDCETLRQ